MTWAAMRELLHSADRERARIASRRAIAERSDYAIEYRITTTAGEKWIAAHGHATYAEDGAVLGTLGIVQDVTEQVRTRELMQRTG